MQSPQERQGDGLTPGQQGHGCRATLIAAPGSGQGKTVFTAALARLLVRGGETVQVFKVGPDYLDPMILATASGRPVETLDWWMMGERACLSAIGRAATVVDVILVEGLMGLYDNAPSNAWLAKRLGLSVTLVMNMAKFAQTAAAVVHGMRQYDPQLDFCGVVGNRLGSEHHRNLVGESMPADVAYAGSIRRDDRMALPERHLGLVQAQEIGDLTRRLESAADCLVESALELHIPSWTCPPCEAAAAPEQSLAGKTIAIARDAAFGFIYRANLSLLEEMGATIVYFSPLVDAAVPDADALWLPGGYPELYLQRLSQNSAMLASVAAFVASGKPGLAECGGMLYLGQTLDNARMVGALDAGFEMTKRFQSVGYQRLDSDAGLVKGHSFHHSRIATQRSAAGRWQKRDGSDGESVFLVGGITASYCHAWFASCVPWTAAVFLGS